jgi:hypothetical protein
MFERRMASHAATFFFVDVIDDIRAGTDKAARVIPPMGSRVRTSYCVAHTMSTQPKLTVYFRAANNRRLMNSIWHLTEFKPRNLLAVSDW